VTALALAVLAASGAAHAQEAVSDPWEGFNRDMYAVHDSVDRAVLEPVARGYRAVTPRPLRQGVRNVLRNLRGPVIFANDLLQGQFARAGVTAARFGVNTTVGLVGVFDPASSMGLERHDEDFGQTLAVWGVDAGPYIFVPLLGPTTVRDGAGRIVDMAFDPLTWARGENLDEWRAARGVATGVSTREQLIETVEDVRRDSVDPYVTLRTSYGLLRESAIKNGPTDVQELPEFENMDELPDAQPNGEDPQQPQAGAPAEAESILAQASAAPTFADKQE
jgi:phospholipid-binding lipoprotein MlaA